MKTKPENVVSLDPEWECTEDNLASTFSTKHDYLRYVARWGQWYEWNGQHWKEDDTVKVFDLVRKHCRESAFLTGEKTKRINAAKATTVAAVERLSKADRRHAATVDQWDRNLWLMNTPTGVVDLRTGELQRHNPDLYMTKITRASPQGSCPYWLKFLDEITGGDKELVRFFKRLIGYSLTGSTREHIFVFFYGVGRNGKGTFLNRITTMLGDYAAVSATTVFTEQRNEQHPADLAALRGARFATAQETEEGRPWNEVRIKALTGGDPITARFMRQDFFTYTPQFKLIVAGNNKPKLKNVDVAMRERLILVPFNQSFTGPDCDKDLPKKLDAELDGIMSWAVEGCKEYAEGGLNLPKVVTDATVEYFSEQDALQQWIDDCCEVGADHWEPPRLLFNSWKAWADAAHEPIGTERSFGDRLQKAGFPRARDMNTRMYKGLKLRSRPPP